MQVGEANKANKIIKITRVELVGRRINVSSESSRRGTCRVKNSQLEFVTRTWEEVDKNRENLIVRIFERGTLKHSRG